MNRPNFDDPFRSKNARCPDTYCAGAAFSNGVWYALIADGWSAPGERNDCIWLPTPHDSEIAAVDFGFAHVENVLQRRGVESKASLSVEKARLARKLASRTDDAMRSAPRGQHSLSLTAGDAAAASANDSTHYDLRLAWVGIDNGASGAIAALFPDGSWHVMPTALGEWNSLRVLDIEKNLGALEEIAARAGGMERVQIAYERIRANKKFGMHNLCQIGRHDEFWRVALTMRRFHFCTVDALTWQSFCWGAKGNGYTKARALAYVTARVADLHWLHGFNQDQQKGIVDAMCIAFWLKASRTGYSDPVICDAEPAVPS